MPKLNNNIVLAFLSFLTVLIGLMLIPSMIGSSIAIIVMYVIAMTLLILSTGILLLAYFLGKHVEKLKGAIK